MKLETGTTSPYVLPDQIGALLASAARLLSARAQNELVALLANGRIEINEATDYDNWDGGQTGHSVRIDVPESLFQSALQSVDKYGAELRDLLNKLADVPHEHIADVRFCLDLGTVSSTWREESGALLSPPTLASGPNPDSLRLWGEGTPRVFLSHRAEAKVEAKKLKDELAKYGAASFVAHEDIEPTRTWQTEIERALTSMDALVALLSEGFAASSWTNQEVGVALGRGIPVVAIRVAEDPRGFIGASQALSGYGKSAADWAKALTGTFSLHERLARQLLVGLVRQWELASSFLDAIRIMDLLDACKTMPPELLARVENAYKANDQLHNSSVVSGRYPGFLARMRATGT